MNKKHFGFGKCLLLYSFLLAAAILVGLSVLWRFLDAYEKSLPESLLETYQAESLREDYRAFLSEAALELYAPLQTGEEVQRCLEEWCSDTKELRVLKNHEESTQEEMRYRVQLDGEQIGTLSLLYEQTEGAFGFHSVMLAEKNWTLPEGLSGTWTLEAPEGTQVTVNSHLLTEETAALEKERIPESALTREGPEAWMDRWDFVYYGEPEIKASGDARLEYAVQKDAETRYSVHTAFLPECCGEWETLAEQFVQAYVDYTSKVGSYGTVQKLMVPGSDMYRRISSSVQGSYWSKSNSSAMQNFKILQVVPYADAVICEAYYDLTYPGGVYNTNIRLLMVETEKGWRVLNMEIL